MTNTIYEVTLTADEAPQVTIKSSDQAAIKAGLGWARQTLEALKAPVKTEPEEPKKEESQETPLCAVHKVPMVWQKGSKGYFWSCHQKDANGWCSYKPLTP